MIELLLLLLFWITYWIAEKCYSKKEGDYMVFDKKGSILFIISFSFLLFSTILAIYNLYFEYDK